MRYRSAKERRTLRRLAWVNEPGRNSQERVRSREKRSWYVRGYPGRSARRRSFFPGAYVPVPLFTVPQYGRCCSKLACGFPLSWKERGNPMCTQGLPVEPVPPGASPLSHFPFPGLSGIRRVAVLTCFPGDKINDHIPVKPANCVATALAAHATVLFRGGFAEFQQ